MKYRCRAMVGNDGRCGSTSPIVVEAKHLLRTIGLVSHWWQMPRPYYGIHRRIMASIAASRHPSPHHGITSPDHGIAIDMTQ
jgi:hypothetical protein